GWPSVGADGQSAANDFSQRREVRADAEQLLRAAQGEAEAGHYFIEDEQGAVMRGDLAQELQVAGPGRHASHVADNRLDDHAGDLPGKSGEGPLDRGAVVVGQGERV